MTDKQDHVYGIAHPHGYVKLGRSVNPQQRLQEHQTSSPYELWLLFAVPVEDADAVEKELHEWFDSKNHRGEWFDLDYSDYDDLIDLAKMLSSHRDFESVADFRAWQQRKREALL